MLRRATRVLVVVALVLVAGLAVTGWQLSTRYRPLDEDIAGLQDAHRLLGRLLLVVGVGLLVTTVGLAGERRNWTEGAVGGLALLLILATSFTGELLPWDQLALWAVTVGTDLDGIWTAAFDDDAIRFVLIDNAEIPQSDYARAVIAHTVVLPVLLVGVLVAIGWRRRAISRTVDGGPGSEPEPRPTGRVGSAPGPRAAAPTSTSAGTRPDLPTG